MSPSRATCMAESQALVIGICQLKGGVGATTLAAALGGCWARAGKTVTLVDFDDVNPHLTSWAASEASVRAAVSRALRAGIVGSVDSISSPIPGYDGKLRVVPQPIAYHESFHYKANVLEGAASATEFVHALLLALERSSDLSLLDLGGSWGMATFAALPHCARVLCIVDDDPLSVSRSFESLRRLSAESDDGREFDFNRWSVVLNGFTNQVISPETMGMKVRQCGLFQASTEVMFVPFSAPGRDWGSAGVTFYDSADRRARIAIEKICDSIQHFQSGAQAASSFNLLQLLRAMVVR